MAIEPKTVSPNTSNSRPGAPIAVLLVDDHPAVRAGARMLIDDQPDMTVVAEAATAEEALSRPELRADLAVVDYHLGDGRDGLSLTTELKQRDQPPRVLVYSSFADNALAVMARITGADGLLDKRELAQELCWAIRWLFRGRQHLPAISPPLAHAVRSRLAPRDQAILGMLLHDTPPGVITERLGITDDELWVRRSSILDSLKPAHRAMQLPTRADGPLDYERARRADRRWAA